MNANLIVVGDSLIINPAHVAYAERRGDFVELHMAVGIVLGDSRCGAATGHPVLHLRDAGAEAVWQALASVTTSGGADDAPTPPPSTGVR